jgi:adenine phosphoribosyltransferase
MDETLADWRHLIRDVPDFPKPGIAFKDITPLLANADGFRATLRALAQPWRGSELEAVVGIESRGFILGAALAAELGVGFVPVRKPGKLPAATLQQEYALEYGTDRLQVHADALPPGARVLLCDDVLATGGTLLATLALAQRLDARVVGAAVLIELAALGGRARGPREIPLESALRL